MRRSSNQHSSHSGRLRRHSSVLAIAIALIVQGAEAYAQVEDEDITELGDMSVEGDPMRVLPNEISASSFGFDKPLLETPRSVSFISEEQISLLGISTADDLSRMVPGTYTNRRWGLQGGIDVRNTSADMYFRGMKRLNMQGHARTALSGMDGIEVVKGPPSPIFGMGKIGGYVNMQPKLGRARTGGYMEESQGFAQLLRGSWNQNEMSMGVGGPMNLGPKSGGYYIYALLEDSDTWVEPVPAKQKILQAASSIDNFIGPFRLEFGGQWQNSTTAGAFVNRVTQDLIDNGNYIRGMPLVNLNADGDYKIGWTDMNIRSPVQGLVTNNNRPLNQEFPWPRNPETGEYYRFGEFPQVGGIPQSMYDYLIDECGGVTGTTPGCSDPTGAMRSQGVGGPVPTSGYLPIGFVLDPTTTGIEQVNYRRAVYEREQDAKLGLAFFDLVYDTNPDFTVRNQFFFDYLDTRKTSQLPYGEKMDNYAIENKLTITKRIDDEHLPDWLRVNSLASINYRVTNAERTTDSGDFDYRQDILEADGRLQLNALFWNHLENPTYESGYPVTTRDKSKRNETGLGVMFDIDLHEKTNILLGARYDYGSATSSEGARFTQSCTEAEPCFSDSEFIGRNLPAVSARNSDGGASWSISLSHSLPGGIRPYATLAESSLALESASSHVSTSVVNAGFIGKAELKEGGIKANLFGESLFISLAAYEQTRTDVSDPDDPTADADVTSTESTGYEFELKWVPNSKLFLSIFALSQKTEYIFASSANMRLSGRDLGFVDVLDPETGEILYPAEAFLYGGRITVPIPQEMRADYLTVNGSPETQIGFNGSYQFSPIFGVNGGGMWLEETNATRLGHIKVPSVFTAYLGVALDLSSWRFQFNVKNLFDERYFRPRNGDTVPDLMSSMQGRSWAITANYSF